MEPNFLYDVESVRCLQRKDNNSGSHLTNNKVTLTSGKHISDNSFWSNYAEFPINDNSVQRNHQQIDTGDLSQSQDPCGRKGGVSTAQIVNIPSNSELELVSVCSSASSTVFTEDIPYCTRTDDRRRYSSTRLDIISPVLDCGDYFLSVSSHCNSDGSEMSEADAQAAKCTSGCECDICAGEQDGTAETDGDKNTHESTGDPMLDQMLQALKEVDGLKDEVKSLRSVVEDQRSELSRKDEVILKLKQSNTESTVKNNPVISAKVVSKEDRFVEARARTLTVLQEKLDARSKISVETLTEASDDGEDLRGIRRKMSRKQRDKCSNLVSSRMEQVGASFPVDNFDSTASSGRESSSVRETCRHSRKIQSGATVKTRPVRNTQLWPHTICNEDDGEDFTHENIPLSKFFACFTFIMMSCRDRIESQGRQSLLYAISTVLEYWHWTDARIFHNIMLLKIEQGVLTWDSDFSVLAENFIDKKVRASIKSRGSAAGTSGTSKSGGYVGKGYGKSFKGSSSRANTGRGRSLHGAVCWQWNYTTCTYGNDCKRWHVCKSCAEDGKLGEKHKASSHDSAGSKPKSTD